LEFQNDTQDFDWQVYELGLESLDIKKIVMDFINFTEDVLKNTFRYVNTQKYLEIVPTSLKDSLSISVFKVRILDIQIVRAKTIPECKKMYINPTLDTLSPFAPIDLKLVKGWIPFHVKVLSYPALFKILQDCIHDTEKEGNDWRRYRDQKTVRKIYYCKDKIAKNPRWNPVSLVELELGLVPKPEPIVYVDFGTQTELEPKMVSTDFGTQTEPEPKPKMVSTDFGTQTEPKMVSTDFGTQTEPEPILLETTLIQPMIPITRDIGMQTSRPMTRNATVQTELDLDDIRKSVSKTNRELELYKLKHNMMVNKMKSWKDHLRNFQILVTSVRKNAMGKKFTIHHWSQFEEYFEKTLGMFSFFGAPGSVESFSKIEYQVPNWWTEERLALSCITPSVSFAVYSSLKNEERVDIETFELLSKIPTSDEIIKFRLNHPIVHDELLCMNEVGACRHGWYSKHLKDVPIDFSNHRMKSELLTAVIVTATLETVRAQNEYDNGVVLRSIALEIQYLEKSLQAMLSSVEKNVLPEKKKFKYLDKKFRPIFKNKKKKFKN